MDIFKAISEDKTRKAKSRIVFVTMTMPDGKEYEVPVPPKIYKSGREGFFAQIPSFEYRDDSYGGQIQIWKKTPKQ